MIRLFKKYLLLCLAALPVACAEDAPQGGDLPAGYSRIGLVLSAEPAPATRWNDTNALDNEMMKSALVVMCNNTTKKVERIIPVNMGTDDWSERRNVAIITTENGSYTFYSFGNIAWTGDTNAVTIQDQDITFTVGAAIPTALADKTLKATFNNYVIPATGIPMTGMKTVDVKNSKTVTLRLFRLLSKIRFDFTNNTDHALTVQKVEMGQVTPDNTDIYLFPRTTGDEDEEKAYNAFPGTVTNTTLTAYDDETTGIALAASKGTGSTPLIYFNESKTNQVLGQTPLVITTKQTVGSEDVIVERNAMMNLSAVPRNSFVTVPITLTDYGMELKAFAYAPIGGYPPYKLEMKDDEFYCTISAAAGDFTLRPFIYKFEDKGYPERWFELTDNTKVDSYSLAISGDNIFTETGAPTSINASGEIMGTLSGTQGKATVTLTANIIAGPDVTLTYKRILYIIVK